MPSTPKPLLYFVWGGSRYALAPHTPPHVPGPALRIEHWDEAGGTALRLDPATGLLHPEGYRTGTEGPRVRDRSSGQPPATQPADARGAGVAPTPFAGHVCFFLHLGSPGDLPRDPGAGASRGTALGIAVPAPERHALLPEWSAMRRAATVGAIIRAAVRGASGRLRARAPRPEPALTTATPGSGDAPAGYVRDPARHEHAPRPVPSRREFWYARVPRRGTLLVAAPIGVVAPLLGLRRFVGAACCAMEQDPRSALTPPVLPWPIGADASDPALPALFFAAHVAGAWRLGRVWDDLVFSVAGDGSIRSAPVTEGRRPATWQTVYDAQGTSSARSDGARVAHYIPVRRTRTAYTLTGVERGECRDDRTWGRDAWITRPTDEPRIVSWRDDEPDPHEGPPPDSLGAAPHTVTWTRSQPGEAARRGWTHPASASTAAAAANAGWRGRP